MLEFKEIEENPQIKEYIFQTEKALSALSYTDHGFRHSKIVAERAKDIARQVGLSKKQGEMASIAGFCHDMGNFLGRSYHNYLAALLFHQVFQKDFNPKELATITQAISMHDEKIREIVFSGPVAAVVVLADKSDVHRSRVIQETMDEIKADIHDRVNYATTSSKLEIDKRKKRIILSLRIDTKFVPVMEYFEIFTQRMIMCRKAAEYLGYNFGLVINKFTLL